MWTFPGTHRNTLSFQIPPKTSGKSSGDGFHVANKHKGPGLVIDEHGMVVGGHYQHQHVYNARQSGGSLIMDEVPSHYHGGGQKVLLDHNDNEMTQGGGHYHHRMGGMVNGGKDPNWRPARRRRKDDVDDRGVSAGVRLYMNTSAHMAVAPIPAGPYNPAHHHQQQSLQQTHHSNTNHPHPKMPPPASPNQIPNHSSHPNASTVSRGGGGGTGSNSSHNVTAPAAATIPVLTVPVNANNPTVILAGHEQPLLVPVVAVASTGAPPPPLPVEVPVRSRRDPHHGSAAHGGAAAGASGANTSGAASSAVTQRTTAVQFDLAASAFPPLPGSSSSSVSTVVGGGGVGDVQQVPVTTVSPSTNVKNLSLVASDSSVVAGKEVEVAGKQSVVGGPADNNKSSNTEGSGPVAVGPAVAAVPVVASAWGDSLADVVKGTAKAAKSSSNANGE